MSLVLIKRATPSNKTNTYLASLRECHGVVAAADDVFYWGQIWEFPGVVLLRRNFLCITIPVFLLLVQNLLEFAMVRKPNVAGFGVD